MMFCGPGDIALVDGQNLVKEVSWKNVHSLYWFISLGTQAFRERTCIVV